jgi:uncharacterized protein (UPF0332 family)
MSKLKEKSEFNIAAAELLLEKDYYAPSLHCSYYSCFQLIKFTIKDFFGTDYETLSSNISSSKKNTHQYIIDYISNELINFTDTKTGRDFKRKIKDLKQFRQESDYDDMEITIEKGNAAYLQAVEIRTYLTNNF